MTPTVFTWPTTLYVRALVAPITRKVDSVTNRPSAADTRMVSTAGGVAVNASEARAPSFEAGLNMPMMACSSMKGSDVASRMAAIGAKTRQSWLESAGVAGAACSLRHSLDAVQQDASQQVQQTTMILRECTGRAKKWNCSCVHNATA
jgi:hypothetical protein